MSERWPGDEAEALEPAEEAPAEMDEPEQDVVDEAEPEPDEDAEEPIPRLRAPGEHAEGELDIPDDVNVIEEINGGDLVILPAGQRPAGGRAPNRRTGRR